MTGHGQYGQQSGGKAIFWWQVSDPAYTRSAGGQKMRQRTRGWRYRTEGGRDRGGRREWGRIGWVGLAACAGLAQDAGNSLVVVGGG